MQFRVTGVLASTCTVVILAPGFAMAQQPGPNDLLRTHGTGWELHAPSEEALERGRQGLDHVVAKFEQVFGEPPVDLVFVLHDTSEQAEAYRHRFPGRTVQMWVNSRARRNSPTDDTGTLTYTSVETIAHEAMHALVDARHPWKSMQRPLPPWLSEGLASFIEPPVGDRQRYWAMLRNFAQHMVSVRELLVTPHPANRATPSPDAPNGNVITMTLRGGPADALLYPHGMALLEYMAEVEGIRFIGRLVDAIAGGATLESVLADSTSLPSDLDVLNRNFRAWLGTRGIPLPDHNNHENEES